MKRQILAGVTTLALAFGTLGAGAADEPKSGVPKLDAPKTDAPRADAARGPEKKWAEPALPDKSTLASAGKNPYFILEQGYQLVLATPDGTDHLTITVLDETKTVDGVETRVVEERETKGGKLVEVSRNYFAISKETADLFYFGEDVDMYKGDQVVNHEGSWLAGAGGAKAGLMLPGKPEVGQRFYQEQAPKVAMDRSEIVGLSETLTTPAGKFTGCLKVTDGSALEPDEAETKLYAPGVGLLVDEDFRLVKYGRVDAKK